MYPNRQTPVMNALCDNLYKSHQLHLGHGYNMVFLYCRFGKLSWLAWLGSRGTKDWEVGWKGGLRLYGLHIVVGFEAPEPVLFRHLRKDLVPLRVEMRNVAECSLSTSMAAYPNQPNRYSPDLRHPSHRQPCIPRHIRYQHALVGEHTDVDRDRS
jgi:hypothetical protein